MNILMFIEKVYFTFLILNELYKQTVVFTVKSLFLTYWSQCVLWFFKFNFFTSVSVKLKESFTVAVKFFFLNMNHFTRYPFSNLMEWSIFKVTLRQLSLYRLYRRKQISLTYTCIKYEDYFYTCYSSIL